MNIFIINAGSSSLKYQLISMTNEQVKAKGIVERIGMEGSVLKYRATGRDKMEIKQDCSDHTEAIKLVISALINKDYGVISSMDEIMPWGTGLCMEEKIQRQHAPDRRSARSR
jgi:acetate kinase